MILTVVSLPYVVDIYRWRIYRDANIRRPYSNQAIVGSLKVQGGA